MLVQSNHNELNRDSIETVWQLGRGLTCARSFGEPLYVGCWSKSVGVHDASLSASSSLFCCNLPAFARALLF
jgi:hypothetical protein